MNPRTKKTGIRRELMVDPPGHLCGWNRAESISAPFSRQRNCTSRKRRNRPSRRATGQKGTLACLNEARRSGSGRTHMAPRICFGIHDPSPPSARPISPWLTVAAACGAFVAVAIAESRRPLRRRREDRTIRFGRNVASAVLSAAATSGVETLLRSPSPRRPGEEEDCSARSLFPRARGSSPACCCSTTPSGGGTG